MHQKSGKRNENSSKNSQNNRNNRDSGSDCERVEDESDKAMRNRDMKEDSCEGFDGNLTEVVNKGNDSRKNELETKFNDKDEEVVKKANVSSQNSGSKETNSSAGKSLADIVKSNRLDNKLIQVPTEINENKDSCDKRKQFWINQEFDEVLSS
nr:hypothetical protein [Tanacetum cinerariifolium]